MTSFKGLHNFNYTYSANSDAVLQYGNFVDTLWFKVEYPVKSRDMDTDIYISVNHFIDKTFSGGTEMTLVCMFDYSICVWPRLNITSIW